jgi:trimeric autotransporter adhesin
MSWRDGAWVQRSWGSGRTLIGVLLAIPGLFVWMTVAGFAEVATTQITDTVYCADGSRANGTVLVSWSAFTNAAGGSVASGSTSATITAGALSVALAPNAGATPTGSYYTAVYHLSDGTTNREFWVVPASQTAVKLSAIKSTVLPTSVAVQTVSKSYVDTAIAAAVAGHPLDSSNPYVLKAGDTMTGPLVLPGDPTAPLQAAEKRYVDASISAGMAHTISTAPQGTQIVAQPTGSAMQVNQLNGVQYASQYTNGRGNNGIANATTSSDCANGCEVKAESSYASTEKYTPTDWNSQTHLEDARSGQRRDVYLDPESVITPGMETGQVIDVTSTRSGAAVSRLNGSEFPASIGLQINHQAVGGGSNDYPQNIEPHVPYFKSGYSALMINGIYNTQGQHVLDSMATNCYGVGDCLIGSQFIVSSGGFRDNADEGAHPFDLQIREDSRVFEGTCATGCSKGSTALVLNVTANQGTQGDGRYLIDTNPKNVLTAGSLVGLGASGPNASAAFSGTSFPVSKFFQIALSIPSQSDNVAPGTVTVAINTTGVPTGFATNTAAATASSGVACIADPTAAVNGIEDFETANYTVVDGTHLQLTLNKAHTPQATVAIGGLCGYGLEQTVDTISGIRQVFPVIGSYSATGLYYAGGATPIVGHMTSTSGYANISLSITSVVRNNNTVTLTTAGLRPVDVNGLTLTVSGVADSSYNGSFAVTTTSNKTLTYTQSGANGSSSGGTISLLTGRYALYPMAEVLSVMNPTNKRVDGTMILAPNIVAWAAKDPVEQPHYYQQKIGPDIEFIGQTMPRPSSFQQAGVQYEGLNGPGLQGWTVTNAVPTSFYYGNGGTHYAPDFAYQAKGVWKRIMVAQPGEQSVFTITCNSHGCNNWASSYNLFELSSSVSVDTIWFQPTTSSLVFNLRGAPYSFTPQGFTAGIINADTVNAKTLKGALSAASLPVFGASGNAHAQGAVPDPGATAGNTRFLREDGTWATPTGAVSSASVVTPHQIVSATPQIHAIGDSITQGAGASTPWPSLLALTNQPRYTTTNWGVSGALLQSITGSEPSRVGQRCLATSGPSIAIVFAGMNDLHSGLTVSATIASMAGEIQTLKLAGCRVFVGTMLSRAGVDAQKDAYDAMILGQAKADGADGVIDFAANPLLGADGAYKNTTYFNADQIHPTQAGQQLLANAASNVLNYTFGYNEANPNVVTTLPYRMTAADGEVSLWGLTNAGAITLPDCTGQSGAVYRIHNPQSAHAVTVMPLNANQLINGLSLANAVTVPANATLTMRDVPNPKKVSGCHWEM